MFKRIRFLSAGESHGPRLTALIDGLPAGIIVDRDAIDAQLARRQKGYGATARMKIERDGVRISAGVMHGSTTGAPVALEVQNRDWANWRDRDVPPMTVPRPGHADLTGAIKYGYRELRLSLERASARETAMRVAAGALCRQFLAALGIEVGGYVVRIGDATVDLPEQIGPDRDEVWQIGAQTYRERIAAALDNDLACPVERSYAPLKSAVAAARKARDTLGGVIEVVALGVPPGLGSFVQWDTRIEAQIAMAMLSVQAMKGVEVGPAWRNAALPGTRVHDAIRRTVDGALERETNRAGGTEGGITTGEPLVVRVAKKPISTTLEPRPSVDLATGEPATTSYERSDFCAVPRAVPILEAMLAMVLTDTLLTKLGGDSMAEITPRFEALRRSHLDDLPLDNEPWRIAYAALDERDGIETT